MTQSNVRRVKEVSKSLKETYKDYFIRGTKKFISRFGFKEDDLGKPYVLPEGIFILTGQISDKILLMEKDGSDYYVEATYFNQTKQTETGKKE